jgi:hypothetical protein
MAANKWVPHVSVVDEHEFFKQCYHRMEEREAIFRNALEKVRCVDHLDPDTASVVLSDRGFCPFRRGINLNSRLRDDGYLALENGAI